MNLERLKDLRNVMQRVADKNLDLYMQSWQSNLTATLTIATDENELHRCGMSACVGGYLAVSPEFKATGGSATPERGTPEIVAENLIGSAAVARFLETESDEEYDLVCRMLWTDTNGEDEHTFYGLEVGIDPTPRDIVDKLNDMIAEREEKL